LEESSYQTEDGQIFKIKTLEETVKKKLKVPQINF